MEEIALDVRDLVVEYQGVRAVNQISFHVMKGEQLTLLGPSGCGKTSTLRGIAGLETPQAGEIILFGKEVFSKKKRIKVPAEKRGMSMVFQSYAIWPHMTVFENVAYPLNLRSYTRKQVKEKVLSTLALVGMEGFEDRQASKLSGGQQQRVALARAIVFDPKIILLDEPLSNLDAKLRAKMRVELKLLQQKLKCTSIYVTHDQEEALVLSDRIILMNQGKIEQMGSPFEIYSKPRTPFAAEFIPSANLFEGRVTELLGRNLYTLEIKEGCFLRCYGGDKTTQLGQKKQVYINSSYFRLREASPDRNVNAWRGKIERTIFIGDYVEYFIETEMGELRARSFPDQLFEEGQDIFVTVDPEYCHLIVTEE